MFIYYKLFIILSLLFGFHMQGCNELFKAEDFTPYDPTQDVIFPPELMVSQPMAWGTVLIKCDCKL